MWLSHVFEEEDGTLVLANQSVQSHRDVPFRENEVVRGILVGDITVLEKTETGVKMTKVSENDR